MSKMITEATCEKIAVKMQSPEMRRHLRVIALQQRNIGLRNTKLTLGQVREIRAYLASGMQGKDIAALYGVSGAQISRIKNGNRWRKES